MQECIQVFEEFLNSKCAKESNENQPTVVDVSLGLNNLAFVRPSSSLNSNITRNSYLANMPRTL